MGLQAGCSPGCTVAVMNGLGSLMLLSGQHSWQPGLQREVSHACLCLLPLLCPCSITRTTLGPHKPVVISIPLIYLVSRWVGGLGDCWWSGVWQVRQPPLQVGMWEAATHTAPVMVRCQQAGESLSPCRCAKCACCTSSRLLPPACCSLVVDYVLYWIRGFDAFTDQVGRLPPPS